MKEERTFTLADCFSADQNFVFCMWAYMLKSSYCVLGGKGGGGVIVHLIVLGVGEGLVDVDQFHG